MNDYQSKPRPRMDGRAIRTNRKCVDWTNGATYDVPDTAREHVVISKPGESTRTMVVHGVNIDGVRQPPETLTVTDPQTTPPARADAAGALSGSAAAQSASPPQVGRVASPSGLRFLRMALAGVREETNALKEAARLLNVEYLDAADRGEGSNDYLDACDAIDKLVLRLEQEKRELVAAIKEARS